MKIIFILLMIIFLTGCESKPDNQQFTITIGNPTAEKVLTTNPEANIFMYSDTIFNAGVPWVDELELTKDKYITEIIQQSDDGGNFMNGTGNKLKIGTKIFNVKERGDVMIAETEDGDIRFYNLVEG
jgi:hypothetical protein